jgi:hypothetical protein
MGNTSCKNVVTNYVVTNNPYYKLHYLVTVILFGLLYFNYLKDEQFEDVENRFVVFVSKYILMPLIINYGLSIVFFNAVQLSNKKLIERVVKKCGNKKGEDLTDREIQQMINSSMRELSPKKPKRRSSKSPKSPKAKNASSPNSPSPSPSPSSPLRIFKLKFPSTKKDNSLIPGKIINSLEITRRINGQQANILGSLQESGGEKYLDQNDINEIYNTGVVSNRLLEKLIKITQKILGQV